VETNQAVNNVFSVRVVPAVGPLATNEVHYLVLSLARDAGIRNVDLHLSRESTLCDLQSKTVAYVLPARVCVEFLGYPVSQRVRKKIHEGCAGRDGIGVPSLFSFRGNLLAHC